MDAYGMRDVLDAATVPAISTDAVDDILLVLPFTKKEKCVIVIKDMS